jgi:hypothetical protein
MCGFSSFCVSCSVGGPRHPHPKNPSYCSWFFSSTIWKTLHCLALLHSQKYQHRRRLRTGTTTAAAARRRLGHARRRRHRTGTIPTAGASCHPHAKRPHHDTTPILDSCMDCRREVRAAWPAAAMRVGAWESDGAGEFGKKSSEWMWQRRRRPPTRLAELNPFVTKYFFY